jgi:hypothetical protein
MAVIISHRVKKKEFKKGIIPENDLQKILDGFREGIFIVIKGENLPKGSRLIKVYSTTMTGARRIIYLVDVLSNDAFFLFYRSKNDKIGKNISINNPEFKKTLHKYLALLYADLEIGAIDIY